MSDRSQRARTTKRWTSAALVIGSTVAVLASPLAIGAASAAVAQTDNAVSISSQNPNSQNQGLHTGAVASLTVNYTTAGVFHTGDTVPTIYLSFLGGPDATAGNTAPKGAACVTSNPADSTSTGTAVCSFTNNGTAGIDTVRAFADNGGAAGTFDNSDVQSATTTVTFTGAPDSVTLTPPNSTSATATCVVYTVSASSGLSPNPSLPAGNRTINIVATEPPTTPTTDPFTHFDVDTSVNPSGVCTTAHAGRTFQVTTGNNGTVKFGLASSTVGSGQVTATSVDNAAANATANAQWVAGGPGAVTKLTVTPTTTTDYVGSTEVFTVTLTDNGNNPIQGVPVSFMSGAPDSIPVTTTCNAPSDQNGHATCQFTNNGTAGTDHLTFWVNNCASTCTTGPDSGEPQATATSTFNPAPQFNSDALTCIDQLATNKGNATTGCTLPLTQHDVVFTETLKFNGNPVSGAIVSFTAHGTISGVTNQTVTGTGTTDANGHATFDVPNAAPVDGDAVLVTAKVGPTALAHNATATWHAPVATKLAVTPPLQSVTKGGAVSATAQVVDQFGAGVSTVNSLTWVVIGRNAGKTATANTDSTGSLQISYTDTGTAGTVDKINVSDNTPPNTSLGGTAEVDYVNGSATASTVTIDTSGSGVDDGSCNASGHTPRTSAALGSVWTVCALVKNSGGEILAGKSVTFTVSNGQVAKQGGLPSTTATTSFTTTTDTAGNAFADVTSTKSGVQTVTAAADSASASSTITYLSPTTDKARNVTIAPTPATITAGKQQKFTATVTDAFGNPAPGVSVVFTQSGPGNIGGQSSATLTTGADGTAAVTLSTVATDSGSGSVVANIATTPPPTTNQCSQLANQGVPPAATAGNCSATATYTVAKAIVPASLQLQVAGAHKVGSQELIAATVKNSDGTPAVNELVRFVVSGANSASGSGVTTPKGVAFIAYTPTRAGTDNISAYDDVNNNGIRDVGEPTGTLSVSILSVAKERPTIRLTSANGRVTVHVTSHPLLAHTLVTYYIERLGVFHAIGNSLTGSAGRAHMSFRKKIGSQFTFRVRVTGKHGVKSGTSAAKSIRVRA